MATQLATPDPIDPPEDGEPGTVERDYEAEARAHGWSPKEEFRGDPSRWVDAEVFVKRAEEVLPLVKAANKHLKREVDELKKTIKRFGKFAEGAEDRIRAEVKAEMEEAVKAGDLEGFRAAQKRADNLDKTEGKAKYTAADLTDAYESFRDDNPWYDRGGLGSATEDERDARIYADRLLERRLGEIKPGEEPPPDEFLAGILDSVKEKYPGLGAKPPRQKPASDVAGAGQPGRGRGTRTWDALPPEAKTQYQRFIDRGLLGVKASGDKDKDTAAARAFYARSHDWDGYAKEAAR